MKLRPLRFLWKQMNGPQATAIMTSIFRWVQDMFNKNIEYLTNFSIATAKGEHLSLIGNIMGVIRPIVTVADAKMFIFTSSPEQDVEYGFSGEPGPLAVGGKFISLEEMLLAYQRTACPDSYYRKVLQAIASSNREPFSIAFIDDLISGVWHSYRPNIPSKVQFEWATKEQEGGTGAVIREDLYIYIGTIADWGAREDALLWQAVFQGIINNVWAPTRKCFVEFL